MKVLVLISLVAFCASLPFTGKRVTVKDNGAITIINSKYELTISRSMENPRNLNAVFKNIYGAESKYEFEEPINARTVKLETLLKDKFIKNLENNYTQMDILHFIFYQKQGVVDDLTYTNILKNIEMLVNYNFLNHQILTLLKNMDTIHTNEVKNVRPVITEEVRNQMMEPKVMTKEIFVPLEDGGVVMREIRNVYNMNPLQRLQMLLQQIKQQSFYQKYPKRMIYPQMNNQPIREQINQQYMTPMYSQTGQQMNDQLMREQMYQHYMTPMYLQNGQQMDEQLIMEQMNQQYMTPMYSQTGQQMNDQLMRKQMYQHYMTPMYSQNGQQMDDQLMMKQMNQEYMTPMYLQNSQQMNNNLMREQMYQKYMNPMYSQNGQQMNDQLMREQMYQKYMTPMYLKQEMNYLPMMKNMYQISPLERWLANIKISQAQEKMEPTMIKNMMRKKMWSIPEMMMDKQMTNQDVMKRNQEMMTENMVEPVPQHIMLKQMTINNPMMLQDTMMDDKIMTKRNQRMSNENTMEEQMMNQKMVGKPMMDEPMMYETMMDEPMMGNQLVYQPEQMETMWKRPMQIVY